MRDSVDLKQGEQLVKLARKTVSDYFEKNKIEITPGGEKRGVFVTINSFPHHELRGCIGFPLPVYPLNEAIARAALFAAFEDPRFSPLEKRELSNVVFEVSVLSVPKPVKASDVKVGRDGLIIEYAGQSGLLLPQVPEEFGWSKEEFLNHLSLKAGLPPETWKTASAKIKAFQADVFSEQRPGGKVEKKT